MSDPEQPAIARASAVRGSPPTRVRSRCELAARVERSGRAGPRRRGRRARGRRPGARAAPRAHARRSGARGANGGGARARRPGGARSGRRREAFAAALDEYVAAQRFNADRPERTRLGDAARRARRERRRPGECRPRSSSIRVSCRRRSTSPISIERTAREDEAERSSAARCKRAGVAPLHHALGLACAAEAHRRALTELAQAAQLAPAGPRYAYVYGVALHTRRGSARDRGARAGAPALSRRSGPAGARGVGARPRQPLAAAGWAEQLVALTPDTAGAPAARRPASLMARHKPRRSRQTLNRAARNSALRVA